MSDDVFVHPNGLCDSTDVGAGTRVWAFAHVMPGARIGRSCNIGESSFVEGGAVLGDGVTVKNGVQVWDQVTLANGVFVGPNATFTNDLRPRAFLKKGPEGWRSTTVGAGATIGANATIVCGHDIGRYALIGAGSVVTGPVPSHALMAGNPARHVAWVCACAERLDAELACAACGRTFTTDGQGGLRQTGGPPDPLGLD